MVEDTQAGLEACGFGDTSWMRGPEEGDKQETPASPPPPPTSPADDGWEAASDAALLQPSRALHSAVWARWWPTVAHVARGLAQRRAGEGGDGEAPA